MKTRQGFVSNSSSASFVIKLSDLTGEQVEQIKNHVTVAPQLGSSYCSRDSWDITVTGDTLEGYTSMTNFDMDEFLDLIGVPKTAVTWTYD